MVKVAFTPSFMHPYAFARKWFVEHDGVVAVFLAGVPPRVQCRMLAALATF